MIMDCLSCIYKNIFNEISKTESDIIILLHVRYKLSYNYVNNFHFRNIHNFYNDTKRRSRNDKFSLMLIHISEVPLIIARNLWSNLDIHLR